MLSLKEVAAAGVFLFMRLDAAVAAARRMCERDGWKLIISGSALSGMLCDQR